MHHRHQGLRNRRGMIYAEYVVLGIIVMAATLAFYQSQLTSSGSGLRGTLVGTFDQLSAHIAGNMPPSSLAPAPSVPDPIQPLPAEPPAAPDNPTPPEDGRFPVE